MAQAEEYAALGPRSSGLATSDVPVSLRPFVQSMVGYRIEGASPGIHIGMPSGTITLVLALDEPLDLIGADGRRGSFDTLIPGLHSHPVRIRHDGFQHGIQLELTPMGASMLIRGPVGEVANTSVDLGEFLGPSARRLHERLSETPGWRDRFALVSDALFARPEASRQPRAEVLHAWRLLEAGRGRIPIREVARKVGWSQRHLGERFREEFGQAPKTTAKVLRFQHSHELVAARMPLADVAAECGYADQSHLNRDWIDLAGTSPTRWLREDEIAFVQDEAATGARA